MNKSLLPKTSLLTIIFALLCGASSQTSSQSAQVTHSDNVIQTTSPSAMITPTNQTSLSNRSINKPTTTNNNIASQEVADKGKVQRVQFARGQNSATFKDAVYQNKDNEYLLDAKAGQTMTVSMKVNENRNSRDADSDIVFQIFKAGDSEPLAKPDSNLWQGRLPETGEYIIRVISFTDNNGYTLKVTVR